MKSKIYNIVKGLNIMEEEKCITPDGEEVNGQVSPIDNLIEIEMKLNDKEKFETIFHELDHINVFATGKELAKADPDWEEKADNFAEITKHLFLKYPPLARYIKKLTQGKGKKLDKKGHRDIISRKDERTTSAL